MEDGKLSLKKFLDLCVTFEHDPTEENQQLINDFLGNLQIKEYMPLKDKAIISLTIMGEIRDDFDAIGSASFIEMGKIFHGLCSYAINLVNDIYPLDKTYAAYDICMRHGLCDKILQHCGTDYNRLCAYVDNAMNVSNAYRLIQTAGLLNTTEYGKWIETMQDVKDMLTPEFMKAIEQINISQGDVGKDIMSLFAINSLRDAEAAILEDKEKYDRIADDLDARFPTVHVNLDEGQ